ncbi:MAG: phenylphosphate carboxylase subunit gamma [Clostridia bacterium]|nr:MAG: phenylphosphate carboxylase subunit gamma [Clostridia bacterium]
MKDWVVFVRTLNDLKDGQEMDLFIRELTPGKYKYRAKRVRALVASSPDKLPGADRLYIRTGNGLLHSQPWYIKIEEELENFIRSRPYGEILRTEA